MAPDEQALQPRRGLALAGPPDGGPVAAARARLAAALEAVTALDAEVEATSARLAAFAQALERALAGPDEEARRAAALVRRLQALAAALAGELARVGAEGAASRSRSGSRSRSRSRSTSGSKVEVGPAASLDGAPEEAWDPDVAGAPDAGAPPAAAGEAVATAAEAAAHLKRLYRRLARLLHPDLAPDDSERARLSGLMARANAAYEAEDLAELELLADRLGAGEPPGELDDAARLAHLTRRAGQLTQVSASLQRELGRLARSETARLEAEAARQGGPLEAWLSAQAAGLAEEAGAARADALQRLDAVAAAARALSGARRRTMGAMVRRGGGAVRRTFDPLAESPLVRRSAARLLSARATAPARALARWLEGAAEAAPWEAGLTLLAFLLEVSGGRPPPAVADAAGLAARWEVLRAGWPGAPDLAGALARLPRHLALGARLGGDEVVAGLQLADASLAPGVRLALAHPAVAALGRALLSALGPGLRCGPCRREVLGLHLVRTRGLDERHGLACPRCGEVLRSYWRYGEAEGLEALWPVALEVGLAGEQVARLGGATLAFGLRAGDLAGLTARGLLGLLDELYLAPCQVALPKGAVRLAGARGLLDGRARLAGAGRLAFRLGPEAGTTADGLVELLRARIERRFRPGGDAGAT